MKRDDVGVMHTERLSGRKGGKWPGGDAEGVF